MIYSLLHKNIEVLTFNFHNGKSPFISIIKIINDSHLPIGVCNENYNELAKSLNLWWETRLIPQSRKIPQDAAAILNDYYEKSYGLNLSDQYWIKQSDSNLTWESVNFFTNDFNEDIGKYIITNGRSTIKEMTSISPDLFSNGEQDKRWIINKNKRFLLKYGLPPYYEQPFNESLASELCRRLNINHTKYRLVIKKTEEHNIYSSCQCFTNENTEYVAAGFIQYVLPKNKKTSSYKHLIECCKKLNMPDIENIKDRISEMVLVDYIMANVDRHYGNFGFIRDANTLEWLGFAPLFDTGNSLFYETFTDNITKSQSFNENIKSKTFATTQNKQLKLFSNRLALMNINFDNLNGIEIYYKELCSKNNHISEKRIEVLKNIIKKRIKDAKRIIYTNNDITKAFLQSIKQNEKNNFEQSLKDSLIKFSMLGKNEKRITETYIKNLEASNSTELLNKISRDIDKL